MQETAAPTKGITPLYAEDINMLEGIEDTKLEAYLEEHLRIIPLFEIEVIETTTVTLCILPFRKRIMN